MDFFSGSTPNLISNKSIKNMENLIKVNNPIKETTLSETISSFYVTYIEPNIFVIIIIIVLILFLVFQYYTKEEFGDKKEINMSLDDVIKDNEYLSEISEDVIDYNENTFSDTELNNQNNYLNEYSNDYEPYNLQTY